MPIIDMEPTRHVWRARSLTNSTVRHCTWKNEKKKRSCHMLWKQKKDSYVNEEVSRKLLPTMIAIGGTETISGFILIMMLHYSVTFIDSLFSKAPASTHYVWLLSFFGLLGVCLSGMFLLLSIALDNQLLAWMCVVFKLCISAFILVLSIALLHCSLTMLMDESALVTTTEHAFPDILLPPCDGLTALNNIPINNACLLGVMSLLGSFGFMAGTTATYTYYKFKYLIPLFEDD